MAPIDCSQPTPSTKFVSVGVRLVFVVWLFVVTDGAALSPFSFLGDVLDGWVWHPVLTVLGLAGVMWRTVAGHRSPEARVDSVRS